mmetsp:Transcript_44206/g.117098  ORF Transcript_44206/g.117098 Transcript_44206/m.117098 type:complete len:139 (-) Transcript_44206:517-933(-)
MRRLMPADEMQFPVRGSGQPEAPNSTAGAERHLHPREETSGVKIMRRVMPADGIQFLVRGGAQPEALNSTAGILFHGTTGAETSGRNLTAVAETIATIATIGIRIIPHATVIVGSESSMTRGEKTTGKKQKMNAASHR